MSRFRHNLIQKTLNFQGVELNKALVFSTESCFQLPRDNRAPRYLVQKVSFIKYSPLLHITSPYSLVHMKKTVKTRINYNFSSQITNQFPHINNQQSCTSISYQALPTTISSTTTPVLCIPTNVMPHHQISHSTSFKKQMMEVTSVRWSPHARQPHPCYVSQS